MAPKIMDGARAKVGLFDPNLNQIRTVGIFSACSYAKVLSHQAAVTLGRFAPAAIQHTGAEPIQITCTGYRIVGHGMHVDASLPRIQDLLLYTPISLTVTDRVTEAQGGNARITVFNTVIPVSGAEGFQGRSLSEITVTYVALQLDGDESVTNAESPGATSLP